MANFGKLLKRLMDENGVNQVELAKKTGISQSSLSDYIRGEYAPKQDKIHLIAEALGVSPAIFLTGLVPIVKESDQPHTVELPSHLPIIGSIAAGKPILAQENITDYFIIDSRVHASYILKVKGDSMINAGILDGDLAFIKQQPEVENGEIAAVLIDSDTATLKRVYRENGMVKLVSENPAVPTKVFDKGEIKVLGKLVAVLNIR